MSNLLKTFDLELPSLKYLFLSHNFLKILDNSFELKIFDPNKNTIESFSFRKIENLYLNLNQEIYLAKILKLWQR